MPKKAKKSNGATMLEATQKGFWFTIKHGWQNVAVFLAIMGILWGAAKPYAEDFIVLATEERIGKVETSFKLYRAEQRLYQEGRFATEMQMKRRAEAIAKTQAVILEKQRAAEVLAKEGRQDIKNILSGIQRLQRR